VFFFWASSGFDDADPLSWAPERVPGVPERRDPASSRLRFATWNIAYGRGWKDDAAGLRPESEIRANLAGIARALRTLDADVVALQEVDFDSARSYRIDEVAFLAREAGYPWAARIETWHCRYVPFPYWPPSRHYGRVVSGQAVLSRYPILSDVRHLLPQPPNPFWYNAFYLHRSIQQVEIDLGGGRAVTVLNAHLEAFHQGNREDHARRLADRVRGLGGRPVVALGDMNAIPPEATLRKAFPDEPGTDMTTDATIATLRGAADGEAFLPSAYRDDERSTFTFPAHAPNRRLDYVFFAGPLDRADGRVAREVGALSDHLPVVADAVLR